MNDLVTYRNKTTGDMNNLTQSEFDVATLFLSEKADNEIEIKENDVAGVVYIAIAIDSEDEWVGFSFKADITKVHTAGELWKDVWGVHCIDTPSVEIDNVTNITVSYNDSNVNNIDYTSRIDDIKKIISDFIYAQKLTAPSKYNVYNV